MLTFCHKLLIIQKLAKTRRDAFVPREQWIGEMAEEVAQEMQNPFSPSAALNGFLLTMSQEELHRLKSLMISGRDDERAVDLYAEFSMDEPANEAGYIAGKLPLCEYLEQGIARAKADGLNLERPFLSREEAA